MLNFADIISIATSVTSVVAIVWAIYQHKSELKAQRNLRSQEIMIQTAALWNGPEMMAIRMTASLWLQDFPADRDPQRWLAETHPDRPWNSLAALAHFLVHVEYLIQDGHIDSKDGVRHIGGAGWWARELRALYGFYSDERRVCTALHSLERRYPAFPNPPQVRIPLKEFC